MTGRQKAVVGGVAAVLLGALIAAAVVRGRGERTGVRMEEVARRDMVATVTASGNVRARRSVDISSDVMGRVVELAVEEGDEVTSGDVVLRLDPTQYRASASRARAALSQARAEAAQHRAGLGRSEREYERVRTLWSRDSTLVSRQQLEEAETSFEVARSQLTAAEHGVEQAVAALEEAEDQLSKTVIRAPISGMVTRLNIDEGETAVVGTMNNPGSLLLTISDLSVVEALLEVDETDIPEISVGDSAVVEIDAFPEKRFSGTVSRIGQSAIRPPSATAGSGQSAAVNFEVVVTLEEPPVLLRPDLSATADIVTAVREDVLSIPIIALTVRQEARRTAGDSAIRAGEAGPLRRAGLPDQEGAFVVRDGRAVFTPVRVGIAGQEHFEVLSGLSAGDTVVAGPYREIRELEDGDGVRRIEDDDEDG